ncbi:MAG: adenylate/guanylate cyclase domain-containing protein [Thermoplasmata archaeon]
MVSVRRLAAIMFTDMVGSTAAAQANEAEALRLRDEQEAIVRPLFSAHQGREIKSTGDGFLVLFDSALRAVECALDIQEHLHQRNSRPNLPPIRLRIGMHLGDVQERAGDVFGDSVNVASRIEPLSDPEGVCISEPVFGLVRNKISNRLEKLEPQVLKGVLFPMDIYRVHLAWTGEGPATTVGVPVPLEKSRIAVLPFVNISPDPADEYFADGMTEELIQKLARVSGLRVVARTTAMTYKNSHATALEIGRALHVGTVVECSVRKAGNRIRITAQLIDARSEEHLWASRYDRELDDIFAIQDDISGQITSAISARLSAGGVPRPLSVAHVQQDTQDITAYTHFLHGLKLFGEKGSEATIREALSQFQKAVDRDPGFARARVGVAEATLWLGAEGALPLQESVERCRTELAKALDQNDALAEAHSVLAGLLVGEDDPAGAEREARRAMELNPSLSDPYRWLAQLAAGDGRIDETVRLLEAAQQINPVDVNIIAFLGRAYVYAGRETDALAHWERTKALIPFRTNSHLAEYYLGLGNYAKVQEILLEMERLRPDSVWTETFRGILAARLGDTKGARRSLERLDARVRSGELPAFFSGFIHFALGEQDAFVACMQEASREHSLPLLELRYSRFYQPARSDPRIQELLDQLAELRKPTH